MHKGKDRGTDKGYDGDGEESRGEDHGDLPLGAYRGTAEEGTSYTACPGYLEDADDPDRLQHFQEAQASPDGHSLKASRCREKEGGAGNPRKEGDGAEEIEPTHLPREVAAESAATDGLDGAQEEFHAECEIEPKRGEHQAVA